MPQGSTRGHARFNIKVLFDYLQMIRDDNWQKNTDFFAFNEVIIFQLYSMMCNKVQWCTLNSKWFKLSKCQNYFPAAPLILKMGTAVCYF